jgi:NAD(P)-dependent dehydrogenase (short-subunit alcohol dehydrogenase family)
VRSFIHPATNSSSGLGLATVLELHKSGAYIAIIDIRDVPESAQRTLGTRSRYFKADLTKDAEIERAVKDSVTWSKQTGAKLGGVVNCAGVAVAQKVCASTLNDFHASDTIERLWPVTGHRIL